MIIYEYRKSICFSLSLGLIVYLFIFYPILSVCLSLTLIGLFYGFLFAISKSKPYTIVRHRRLPTKNNELIRWLIEQIQIPSKQNVLDAVVAKQNADIDLHTIIDDICDHLLDDIVFPWYKEVSSEQITLAQTFKHEIHSIVTTLKGRCVSIDWVKVISNDLVLLFADHYREVRRASLNPLDYPFRLQNYLESEEKENEYLRLISESMLILLLPSWYSSTILARHLIREVFVFNVLKPTISLICEPDYLNQTIISKIEERTVSSEQRMKKFTLASNYESFIRLIENSNELDKLEQFWNYIVTEIMQATAIKNLMKEGVISKENNQARLGTKGELLINRDLTKYLNQLRCAKIVCERCITANGGRSYLLVDASRNKMNLANQKIIVLPLILSSITGRYYLHQFLETFGTHALLKFWYDIWKLKSAPLSERHRIANNLYETYILRFGSAVRDEIDDATVLKMKSYLLGQQTEPDVFYQAQKVVYEVLKRDYYASFLVSKQYDTLCRAFDTSKLADFDLKEQLLGWSTPTSTDEHYDEMNENRDITDSEASSEEPSQSVPKRLADLRDQLANKQYALHAAREASAFDEKILVALEQECADLNQEISTLECLLENVDVWWSALGQWQAQVLCDVMGDSPTRLAVLIQKPKSDPEQTGWVVTRSFHAWRHFYMRLKEIKSSLPNVDLFRDRNKSFAHLQYDKILLKHFQEQFQHFLQMVLDNEETSSFELVYQYLNPSIVDIDRQPANPLGKQRRSAQSPNYLSQLFRSAKTKQGQLELDRGPFLDDRADSIAKPFYHFIDILFDEQRGLLKLIRMTLVQFIRVTYGSTINRQVRRYIFGLFQEEYFVKYLVLFRDTFWPENPSTEKRSSPTDEEKTIRRQQAKQQLLTNIPETATLIFGTENARLGTERLFELFQDIRLNKHLFYKFMTLILIELFPELPLKR